MSTVSSTSSAEEPAGLTAFKQAFRRHAAGVAIITTLDRDGHPVGFTATSLASLSAAPPLATFNMSRSASSWPAMEHASHVIIHTLGVLDLAIAQRLSGDHTERFTGEHWAPGPLGLPVLSGVTAWMLGRIVSRTEIAGGAVVAAEIESGAIGEPDEALLYHERVYMRPAPLG